MYGVYGGPYYNIPKAKFYLLTGDYMPVPENTQVYTHLEDSQASGCPEDSLRMQIAPCKLL